MPPLFVYNSLMRSKIILVLWIAGILFPLVGLRRFSTPFHLVFDAAFKLEWVHIAMHILLYAGLGFLLITLLNKHLNRGTFMKLAGVALIIGISQEGLQWLVTSDIPSRATMLQLSGFDLGVDLAGVILGMALALWSQKLPGYPDNDNHITTKARER